MVFSDVPKPNEKNISKKKRGDSKTTRIALKLTASVFAQRLSVKRNEFLKC